MMLLELPFLLTGGVEGASTDETLLNLLICSETLLEDMTKDKRHDFDVFSITLALSPCMLVVNRQFGVT